MFLSCAKAAILFQQYFCCKFYRVYKANSLDTEQVSTIVWHILPDAVNIKNHCAKMVCLGAKNVDEIDSMVEVIVSNKHSCFTKVQN
jgi:hypothetical protein